MGCWSGLCMRSHTLCYNVGAVYVCLLAGGRHMGAGYRDHIECSCQWAIHAEFLPSDRRQLRAWLILLIKPFLKPSSVIATVPSISCVGNAQRSIMDCVPSTHSLCQVRTTGISS